MASYSLIFSIEFFFKNLKRKFEVGQTVVELDIRLSNLDMMVSKPGIPILIYVYIIKICQYISIDEQENTEIFFSQLKGALAFF